MLNITIDQIKKAGEQLANHRAQVSGCWGISGAKFCEETGANYERAKAAQDGANAEALRAAEDEAIAQAVRLMKPAKIYVQQAEAIAANVRAEFYEEEEGAEFWADILEQIAETADEYGGGLEEFYKSKMAEYYREAPRGYYFSEWEYNTVADYFGSCEPSAGDADFLHALGYRLSDWDISQEWDIYTDRGLYRGFEGDTEAEAREQFALYQEDEAGEDAKGAKIERVELANIHYSE